jgi:UDP-N-acetylmuramate--alanine ligase
VLSAARRVTKGQVVAVMQPHRYSRLHSLYNEFCTCFNNADQVIIAPVYAAGEAPIEGVTHDHLVQGVKDRGHRAVFKIDNPEQLAPLVHGLVKQGDIVVCLGAGTITQWAYALPGQLAAIDKA